MSTKQVESKVPKSTSELGPKYGKKSTLWDLRWELPFYSQIRFEAAKTDPFLAPGHFLEQKRKNARLLVTRERPLLAGRRIGRRGHHAA